MNLKNKAVLVTTSVIAASALLLASPALASKGPGKSNPKESSKTVVATPAPTTPPAPPTFGGPGDRDGNGRGHEGRGHGPKGDFAPITQTVTVDVPATGTYQLLVTEVKPANISPTQPVVAPDRPDHSFTVDVTGTGSQTITLNLPHPGDYKVALISVVSTQSITVAPPVK